MPMQANYSMQHKNMGEHFGSLDTPESEPRERSVGGGSASGLNPKLMTAAHLSQISGLSASKKRAGFLTGGSLLSGLSGLPYKSNLIPSRYSSVLQEYRRRGSRMPANSMQNVEDILHEERQYLSSQ